MKPLNFPVFFPDATYGKVKSVNNKDLQKCKIDGLVVNTYHLLKHNLISEIERAGGIHKFTRLNIPFISDSGGFQVFSLIHKNPQLGKITDNEAIFTLDNKKIILTPEKCIQLQLKIGADIIMCLDDCTHADFDLKKQKKSVERTVNWARRCKLEFDKLTKHKESKPLLFAIIQGGKNKELRKFCAKELIKLDFDGYAFGGFPIKNGKLLKGILKLTESLIPDNKPKYAMGVGKPQDIIDCYKLGYNIFDCVIPTRDARHKRLYVFTSNKLEHKEISIRKKFFKHNLKFCNCELCKNYSIKEIYDLFNTNREKAERLATIHNLTFYSELMTKLRKLLV